MANFTGVRPDQIGDQFDVALGYTDPVTGVTNMVGYVIAPSSQWQESTDIQDEQHLVQIASPLSTDRYGRYPKVSQGDWTHGEGQLFFVDPQKYYLGIGVDVTKAGHLALLPSPTSTSYSDYGTYHAAPLATDGQNWVLGVLDSGSAHNLLINGTASLVGDTGQWSWAQTADWLDNAGDPSGGTATFRYPVTVGNRIVVAAAAASDTTAMTDSLGNTYTEHVSQADPGGIELTVWSAEVTTGGVCTVTGTGASLLLAHEYAGLATSSPVDVSHGANGTSTSPNSGNTGNTTASNELCFGAILAENLQQLSPGTSDRRRGNAYDLVGTQLAALMTQDHVAAASGNPDSTATTISPSEPWAAIAVVFKTQGATLAREVTGLIPSGAVGQLYAATASGVVLFSAANPAHTFSQTSDSISPYASPNMAYFEGNLYYVERGTPDQIAQSTGGFHGTTVYTAALVENTISCLASTSSGMFFATSGFDTTAPNSRAFLYTFDGATATRVGDVAGVVKYAHEMNGVTYLLVELEQNTFAGQANPHQYTLYSLVGSTLSVIEDFRSAAQDFQNAGSIGSIAHAHLEDDGRFLYIAYPGYVGCYAYDPVNNSFFHVAQLPASTLPGGTVRAHRVLKLAPTGLLHVQSSDNTTPGTNLLPAAVQNGTGGWTAQTNAQAPIYFGGLVSMFSAASGTMSYITAIGLSGVAVTAGSTYTALAQFTVSTGGHPVHFYQLQPVTIGIAWYDAGGALLSTSTSAAITEQFMVNVQPTISAQAPTGAHFAALVATVQSTEVAGAHHTLTLPSLAQSQSSQTLLVENYTQTPTTGVLTTANYDFGTPTVDKQFQSIEFTMNSLLDPTTVSVAFRLNNMGTYTPMTTLVSPSANTLIAFFPAHTIGHTVQYQITLTASASITQPDIASYSTLATLGRSYQFTLSCRRMQMRRGQPEPIEDPQGLSGAQLLANIENAYGLAAGMVTLFIPDATALGGGTITRQDGTTLEVPQGVSVIRGEIQDKSWKLAPGVAPGFRQAQDGGVFDLEGDCELAIVEVA